jgi:hypothetical protein
LRLCCATAAHFIFNDLANRPAILDDGPVPQARMRSGRKLGGAKEERHQSSRKAREMPQPRCCIVLIPMRDAVD